MSYQVTVYREDGYQTLFQKLKTLIDCDPRYISGFDNEDLHVIIIPGEKATVLIQQITPDK